MSFKPLKHNCNGDSYAALIEVDWELKEIVRKIKIPSANFSTNRSYMRSNLQGVDLRDGLIYLALWNYVVIMDYASFEIVESFSHPLMSDLHGIAVTREHVYVCSTSIDAVLGFDRSSKELVYLVRADELGLSKKIALPRFTASLFKETGLINRVLEKWKCEKKIKSKFRLQFLQKDFRGIDKSRTGLHSHHLNEVAIIDEKLLLLTKGWNDMSSGSLIGVSNYRRECQYEFMLQPGSLNGPHDIVLNKGMIFMTESETGSIAWIHSHKNAKVNRQSLARENHFVRGLCDTADDTFLVGFTPSRHTSRPEKRYPFVREYDYSFQHVLGTMQFKTLYSGVVGGAIHSIIPVSNV